MKIKKDWFGMFSSTREYARSIYVREPTEEVEKRIWTKRIKTAGVLMAALLLSFLYCLFQPSDTQEILDGYVVRRQEQEQSLAVTAESNDGQKLWKAFPSNPSFFRKKFPMSQARSTFLTKSVLLIAG